MLQDVAVGWLQKYRNEAPARVMSKITDEDGAVISDVIRVGKTATMRTSTRWLWMPPAT